MEPYGIAERSGRRGVKFAVFQRGVGLVFDESLKSSYCESSEEDMFESAFLPVDSSDKDYRGSFRIGYDSLKENSLISSTPNLSFMRL